jgi:hypothetical protein
MNVLQEDRILRTGSLSYGFGDVPIAKPLSDGRFSIDDPKVVSVVKKGQLLSAHQAGKTDFLLFFGQCDYLWLENVWIQNANSMALVTQQCNILLQRMYASNQGMIHGLQRAGMGGKSFVAGESWICTAVILRAFVWMGRTCIAIICR